MFNFLKAHTHYPDQVISDKQLQLLEMIDNKLIELHPKFADAPMRIECVSIPLIATIMPLNLIIKKLSFKLGVGYIPRSIALVVDSSGNWVILYAIRDSVCSDSIATTMFVELLNRTNNARK